MNFLFFSLTIFSINHVSFSRVVQAYYSLAFLLRPEATQQKHPQERALVNQMISSVQSLMRLQGRTAYIQQSESSIVFVFFLCISVFVGFFFFFLFLTSLLLFVCGRGFNQLTTLPQVRPPATPHPWSPRLCGSKLCLPPLPLMP